MRHKMGLNPSPHDKRTLLFSDYRTSAPIHLPTRFGLTGAETANWLMLGNGPDPTVDPNFPGAGDCFFAGRAHGTYTVEILRAGKTIPNPFTARDVLRAYSGATGYRISDDPNNPTDQGTDPISGLKYCRSVGIPSGGGAATHKLGGFVAIEPGNWTEIQEALYLFGSVGLGLQLPDYAEAEFEQRHKWSVRSGGQIEGGHWVEGVEYDGGLQLVTWGAKIPVTKGFVAKYCDAPYALLSPEILQAGGKSPAGFDLAQLQADLAAL